MTLEAMWLRNYQRDTDEVTSMSGATGTFSAAGSQLGDQVLEQQSCAQLMGESFFVRAMMKMKGGVLHSDLSFFIAIWRWAGRRFR